MKRRNFLMAAPVACIPAVAQGTSLSFVDSETPVAELFREWLRLRAEAEDRRLTDDEVDSLTMHSAIVESRINTTPSKGVEDMLIKVCVATDFGFFASGGCVEVGWFEAKRHLLT